MPGFLRLLIYPAWIVKAEKQLVLIMKTTYMQDLYSFQQELVSYNWDHNLVLDI